MSRTPRLLAAVLTTGLLGLASPTPASAVASPECATTPTEVTWTATYGDGYYRLAAAQLDGLAGCTGAQLTVRVGSAAEHLAELEVTVPDGVLSLDLTPFDVPASDVDQISLSLSMTMPQQPGPAPVRPTEPAPVPPTEPAPQPPTAGTPGSSTPGSPIATSPEDAAPSPGHGITVLPRTGASLAWWTTIAVALILVGLWLRRRGAEPREVSDA